MKKTKQTKNLPFRIGATLIETIVYTFLLLSFLIIISEAFFSILDLEKETGSTSNIVTDGRFISARIQYDIANADNISVPLNPGEQSSLLQLTIDGVSHSYTLNNSAILLIDDLGGDQLNSYDTQVSDLSFLRLGNIGGKNAIKINFTLTSITQLSYGQEVQNFEIVAGTR